MNIKNFLKTNNLSDSEIIPSLFDFASEQIYFSNREFIENFEEEKGREITEEERKELNLVLKNQFFFETLESEHDVLFRFKQEDFQIK